MNIIVPIDFSKSSNNAAQFAAKMLQGQEEAKLILFHVYSDVRKHEQIMQELKDLKVSLLDENLLQIECIGEKHDNFLESLERKVRHLGADLVVMGLEDKNRFEQVVGGANALKMIERNVAPVLVVPQNAQYSQIKNVAIASDFKNVASSIPIVPVKKVLSLFKPNLHIVNINSDIYVSLSEEYLEQRAAMQDLFAGLNPEFYFITTYDFQETLQQFVKDKQIDLVLTFPRTHSFFTGLVKTSETKKLVFKSEIPVLAAHE